MLNVVIFIIPEGCAFGSFELLNLHHYTDSIVANRRPPTTPCVLLGTRRFSKLLLVTSLLMITKHS